MPTTRYLALSQYLRLLAVSFTLPLLVTIPGPVLARHRRTTRSWRIHMDKLACHDPDHCLQRTHKESSSASPPAGFLAPLFLTVTALFLLPEGTSLLPPDALAPVAAFLAIGWMAGGGLSTTALTSFARQLPITIAFIAILAYRAALPAGLGTSCVARGFLTPTPI